MDEFIASLPPSFFPLLSMVTSALVVVLFWLLHRNSRQNQRERSDLQNRFHALEIQNKENLERNQNLQVQVKVFETQLTDANLQKQNIRQDYERRLVERDHELRQRDERILGLEKRKTEVESQQNA
ncbi:MAG: hypothetical protein C5B49_15390, partial [Bdellovibrio sp.]